MDKKVFGKDELLKDKLDTAIAGFHMRGVMPFEPDSSNESPITLYDLYVVSKEMELALVRFRNAILEELDQ